MKTQAKTTWTASPCTLVTIAIRVVKHWESCSDDLHLVLYRESYMLYMAYLGIGGPEMFLGIYMKLLSGIPLRVQCHTNSWKENLVDVHWPQYIAKATISLLFIFTVIQLRCIAMADQADSIMLSLICQYPLSTATGKKTYKVVLFPISSEHWYSCNRLSVLWWWWLSATNSKLYVVYRAIHFWSKTYDRAGCGILFGCNIYSHPQLGEQ